MVVSIFSSRQRPLQPGSQAPMIAATIFYSRQLWLRAQRLSFACYNGARSTFHHIRYINLHLPRVNLLTATTSSRATASPSLLQHLFVITASSSFSSFSSLLQHPPLHHSVSSKTSTRSFTMLCFNFNLRVLRRRKVRVLHKI